MFYTELKVKYTVKSENDFRQQIQLYLLKYNAKKPIRFAN